MGVVPARFRGPIATAVVSTACSTEGHVTAEMVPGIASSPPAHPPHYYGATRLKKKMLATCRRETLRRPDTRVILIKTLNRDASARVRQPTLRYNLSGETGRASNCFCVVVVVGVVVVVVVVGVVVVGVVVVVVVVVVVQQRRRPHSPSPNPRPCPLSPLPVPSAHHCQRA
ncbi:unnamed protein product [Lota lota]